MHEEANKASLSSEAKEPLHPPCSPPNHLSVSRILWGILLLLLGGVWTLFWVGIVVMSITAIDHGGGQEATGDAAGSAIMAIPGLFVLCAAIFLFWSARAPSKTHTAQDAARQHSSAGRSIMGGLLGAAASFMTWLFFPPILILAGLYRLLGFPLEYENLIGFNLALTSLVMLAAGAIAGVAIARRMGTQREAPASEGVDGNAKQGPTATESNQPSATHNRYRVGLIAAGGAVVCVIAALFWTHAPKTPVALEPVIGAQPGEERTFAGITFCWCPPGSFMMGSPDNEKERKKNEGPQHMVTFKQGFWMSKYEITHGQWLSIEGFHPVASKGNDRLPMDRISWHECQYFLHKLNTKGAGTFRLPSEAEWEYACRAGTQTPFFFGETISNDQASLERDALTPVGSFPGNAWNLCDMHGGVREWCQDSWQEKYTGAPNDGSAWELSETGDRVFRSGGWDDMDRGLVDRRSASRGHVMPGMHDMELGFRIVRTP